LKKRIVDLTKIGYGVWNFGRYRSLRGELSDAGRRFELELQLGNRVSFNRKFTRVTGSLDASDKHIMLRGCYVGHESTKYGRNKVKSKIRIHAFTKLESSVVIRSLKFKTLEVKFPKQFKTTTDLFSLFLQKGITKDTTKSSTVDWYENERYKIQVRTIVPIKQVDGAFKANIEQVLVIQYKNPQNVDRIIKDLDIVRNLITLCSYFNQVIVPTEAELYYESFNKNRVESPTILHTKNVRPIKQEDDEIYWWLFAKLLKNPQETYDRYFNLLKTKRFQYVLDVYLSHYVPTKSPTITIEMQFLNAVQLIEATYERLVEDAETEIKRKIKNFSCKCGNNYCQHCTRLQLRDLQAKLRKLIAKAFDGNEKYKDFSLPYTDISNTRNYHTHGKKNSKRPLMSSHDIHRTNIKLEYLFLYLFFLELGFKRNELDKALSALEPFSWVIGNRSS
jgi:hypothetical protein